MKALASFIMRGRWQAALVVALSTLLPLLLQPLLFFSAPLLILSMGTLALVTLRQGGIAGLLVIGIAIGCMLVVGFPLLASAVLQLVAIVLVVFWLPIWLLARILRSTVSWAWALITAMLLGALIVFGFYLFFADPTGWWSEVLNAQMKALLADSGMISNQAAWQDFIALLAPLMPGIIAASLLINLLLALVLGRWWQSQLYNPGGFREEFHQLRLGRPLAGVTMVIALATLVLNWPLLANLLLVLTIIYLIQGFALAHGLVHKTGASRGWLIALYALTLFAPQFLTLLCLLALIDAWIDFRARAKAAD